MNTTSQFTSNFWNIYIAVIVVLSFIGLAWLLLSQNVVKRPKKGEEVKGLAGCHRGCGYQLAYGLHPG